MNGMDFTADHYFRASVERMSQAQHLYRQGEGYYALAMYAAGLAVECLLRAYMVKRSREFESRHNLLLLFKESGILDVDIDKWKAKGWTEKQIEAHQKGLRSSVDTVFVLWQNNYRFASEARLLAHLRKMKLYQGVRGSVLKAKAYDLLNAAQSFIDKGVLQWR
jgi:HEPN domain-containing protein